MKLLATFFASCLMLFAQWDKAEPDALQNQTVELYKEGRYIEAIGVALKVVALAERIYALDDPNIAPFALYGDPGPLR